MSQQKLLMIDAAEVINIFIAVIYLRQQDDVMNVIQFKARWQYCHYCIIMNNKKVPKTYYFFSIKHPADPSDWK